MADYYFKKQQSLAIPTKIKFLKNVLGIKILLCSWTHFCNIPHVFLSPVCVVALENRKYC